MAESYRGLTIKIGGDVTPLKKSLADVNKSITATSSGLRKIGQAVKLDPTNVEAYNMQVGYMANLASTTAMKLQQLKKAAEEVGSRSVQLSDSDEVTTVEKLVRSMGEYNNGVGNVSERLAVARTELAGLTRDLNKAHDEMSSFVADAAKVELSQVKAAFDLSTLKPGTDAYAAKLEEISKTFEKLPDGTRRTDEQIRKIVDSVSDLAKELGKSLNIDEGVFDLSGLEKTLRSHLGEVGLSVTDSGMNAIKSMVEEIARVRADAASGEASQIEKNERLRSEAAQKELDGINSAIAAQQEKKAAAEESANALEDEAQEQLKQLKTLEAERDALRDSLGEDTDVTALEERRAAIEQNRIAEKNLGSETVGANERSAEATKITKEQVDSLVESTRKAREEAVQFRNVLQAASDAGQLASDESLAEANRAVNEAIKEHNAMLALQKRMASEVGEAEASALDETKRSAEEAGDALANLVEKHERAKAAADRLAKAKQDMESARAALDADPGNTALEESFNNAKSACLHFTIAAGNAKKELDEALDGKTYKAAVDELRSTLEQSKASMEDAASTAASQSRLESEAYAKATDRIAEEFRERAKTFSAHQEKVRQLTEAVVDAQSEIDSLGAELDATRDEGAREDVTKQIVEAEKALVDARSALISEMRSRGDDFAVSTKDIIDLRNAANETLREESVLSERSLGILEQDVVEQKKRQTALEVQKTTESAILAIQKEYYEARKKAAESEGEDSLAQRYGAIVDAIGESEKALSSSVASGKRKATEAIKAIAKEAKESGDDSVETIGKIDEAYTKVYRNVGNDIRQLKKERAEESAQQLADIRTYNAALLDTTEKMREMYGLRYNDRNNGEIMGGLKESLSVEDYQSLLMLIEKAQLAEARFEESKSAYLASEIAYRERIAESRRDSLNEEIDLQGRIEAAERQRAEMAEESDRQSAERQERIARAILERQEAQSAEGNDDALRQTEQATEEIDKQIDGVRRLASLDEQIAETRRVADDRQQKAEVARQEAASAAAEAERLSAEYSEKSAKNLDAAAEAAERISKAGTGGALSKEVYDEMADMVSHLGDNLRTGKRGNILTEIFSAANDNVDIDYISTILQRIAADIGLSEDAVRRLIDSWGELKTRFRDTDQDVKALIQVAMFQDLEAEIKKSEAYIKNLSKTIADMSVPSNIAREWTILRETVKSLGEEYQALSKIASSMSGILAVNPSDTQALDVALKALVNTERNVVEEADAIKAHLGKYDTSSIEEFADHTKSAKQQLLDAAEAVTDAEFAYTSMKGTLDQLTTESDALSSKLDQQRVKYANLAEEIKRLEEIPDRNDAEIAKLDKLRGEYDRLAEEIKQNEGEQASLNARILTMRDSVDSLDESAAKARKNLEMSKERSEVESLQASFAEAEERIRSVDEATKRFARSLSEAVQKSAVESMFGKDDAAVDSYLSGFAESFKAAVNRANVFGEALKVDPSNTEMIELQLRAVTDAAASGRAEMESLKAAISTMDTDQLDEMRKRYGTVENAVRQTSLAVADLVAKIKDQRKAFEEMLSGEFAESVKGMREGLLNFDLPDAGLGDAYDQLPEKVRAAREEILDLIKSYGDATEASSQAAQLKKWQSYQAQLASVAAEMEKVRKAENELVKQSLVSSSVDGDGSIKRLGEQLDAAVKRAKEFKAALEVDPKNLDVLTAKQKAYDDVAELSRKRIELINNALAGLDASKLEKVRANFESTAEAVGKTQAELVATKSAYDSAIERLSKRIEGTAFDGMAKDILDSVEAAEQLGPEIAEVIQEVLRLRDAWESADRAADDALEAATIETLQSDLAKTISSTNVDGKTEESSAAFIQSVQQMGQIAERAGRKIIESTNEIDAAYRDMRKTVQGTETQFKELYDAAIDFSQTHAVTADTILEMESLGGQLGLAADELARFGEISSNLDIATDISADQIALQLGQIKNLMSDINDMDSMERFADALVRLGNNAAAQESSIMDIAQRIAAVANVTSMTTPELLGWSAAIAETGQHSESAATSLVKTITGIGQAVAGGGKNLEQFATIAHMTADEFEQAWKNSSSDALRAFVDGLSDLTDESTDAIAALESVGIKSVRQETSLLALSQTVGNLTDNMTMASNAFNGISDDFGQAGDAAIEAQNKSQGFSGQLQILKNNAAALATALGEGLLPFIEAASGALRILADVVNGLPGPLKSVVVVFGGLSAAIGTAVPILDQFKKGWEKMGVSSASVVSTLGSMKTSLSGLASSMKTFISALIDAIANHYTLGEAMNFAAAAAGTMGAAIKMAFVTTGILAVVAVVGQLIGVIGDAIEKAHALNEAKADLVMSTNRLRDAVNGATKAERDFNSEIANVGMSVDEATQFIQRMIDKQNQLAEKFEGENYEIKVKTDLVDEAIAKIEELGNNGSALSGLEQVDFVNSIETLNKELGLNLEVTDAASAKVKDLGKDAEVTAGQIADMANESFVDEKQDMLLERRHELMVSIAEAEDELAKAQEAEGGLLEENAELAERNASTFTNAYVPATREALDSTLSLVNSHADAMGKMGSTSDAVKTAQDVLQGYRDDLADVEEQLRQTGSESQAAADEMVASLTEVMSASSDLRSVLSELEMLDGFSFDNLAYQFAYLGGTTEDFAKLTTYQLMTILQAYDGTSTSIATSLQKLGVTLSKASKEAQQSLQTVTKATDEQYDHIKYLYDQLYTQQKRIRDDYYEGEKRALDDAYTAHKNYLDAVYEEYKDSLDAQYEAEKRARDDEYDAAKRAFDKIVEARKDELDQEYNDVKNTLDAIYDARKRELDHQYDATKKSYSKAYDARKKQLSKEYDAMKDASDAYLKQYKKNLDEQVDAFKKATDERLKDLERERDYKQKLLDDEYEGYDSEIQSRIDAINAEQDAEDEALEKAEQEAKLAELQKAIDTAKTEKKRKEAENDYQEYVNELERKRVKKSRQAAIEQLKAQQEALKKQKEERDKELDDSYDTAVESYKEAREQELELLKEANEIAYDQAKDLEEAKLEMRKEANEAALEQMKEEQDAQLQIIKEQNEDALKALKTEHDAILDGIKANNDALIDDLKEDHELQLTALKRTHEDQLTAIKNAQEADLELRKQENEAELTSLKRANEDQLTVLKRLHEDELDAIKNGYDAALKSLKDGALSYEDALAQITGEATEAIVGQTEDVADAVGSMAEGAGEAAGSSLADGMAKAQGSVSKVAEFLGKTFGIDSSQYMGEGAETASDAYKASLYRGLLEGDDVFTAAMKGVIGLLNSGAVSEAAVLRSMTGPQLAQAVAEGVISEEQLFKAVGMDVDTLIGSAVEEGAPLLSGIVGPGVAASLVSGVDSHKTEIATGIASSIVDGVSNNKEVYDQVGTYIDSEMAESMSTASAIIGALFGPAVADSILKGYEEQKGAVGLGIVAKLNEGAAANKENVLLGKIYAAQSAKQVAEDADGTLEKTGAAAVDKTNAGARKRLEETGAAGKQYKSKYYAEIASQDDEGDGDRAAESLVVGTDNRVAKKVKERGRNEGARAYRQSYASGVAKDDENDLDLGIQSLVDQTSSKTAKKASEAKDTGAGAFTAKYASELSKDDGRHLDVAGNNLVVNTTNAIVDHSDSAKTGATAIASKIYTDLTNDEGGWAKVSGNNFVVNIINGMMGALSGLSGASSAVAGTIASYLHHSTPEKGPLSDDDEWGGDLVQNIIDGMASMQGQLRSQMAALSETVAGGFNPAMPAVDASVLMYGTDDVTDYVESLRKREWLMEEHLRQMSELEAKMADEQDAERRRQYAEQIEELRSQYERIRSETERGQLSSTRPSVTEFQQEYGQDELERLSQNIREREELIREYHKRIQDYEAYASRQESAEKRQRYQESIADLRQRISEEQKAIQQEQQRLADTQSSLQSNTSLYGIPDKEEMSERLRALQDEIQERMYRMRDVMEMTSADLVRPMESAYDAIDRIAAGKYRYDASVAANQTQSYDNRTFSVNINIPEVVVREQADVDRISNEIALKVQRELASRIG